jgi:zinc transport system substrate-binding protein
MKRVYTFLFIIVVLSIATFFLLSRQKQQTNDIRSKISIVTSFYPLYFFTKEITQDAALVTNITPAGSEPHDYEPTAQQIARIERSDLIILQDGTLESWGKRIQTTYGKKVVFAGENGISQTLPDPHTWLDPVLAKNEVQIISRALISIDPQHAIDYEHQTQILLDQLSQLDTEYKNGLSSCQRRDFITSHAAFAHLAQEYKLNQISISGISPDSEPTAKDMTDIITFAKNHNITHIFFERLVSPKLADTIARELGVKTMILDPIEGITDQQMKDGANYFTIMRENLRALQIALQCHT